MCSCFIDFNFHLYILCNVCLLNMVLLLNQQLHTLNPSQSIVDLSQLKFPNVFAPPNSPPVKFCNLEQHSLLSGFYKKIHAEVKNKKNPGKYLCILLLSMSTTIAKSDCFDSFLTRAADSKTLLSFLSQILPQSLTLLNVKTLF